MKKIAILLILTIAINTSFSQKTIIKPGFSKKEYTELIKVNFSQSASYYKNKSKIGKYKIVYRSNIVGLDNRWDLWLSGDTLAVLSIRGTTSKTQSWLENLYTAMVPASGSVTFAKDSVLNYQISDDKKVAVHAGWLIGAVSLFHDMKPKIDSCISLGINNYYIVGHSQGGAISYLINSLLQNLKKQNLQYKPLIIKTYSSAAPKPGNLYYAYEYESYTQNGWAYNLVNSADWVPQTPFSVQTIDDFNKTNPFIYIDEIFKKTPFLKRIYIKRAFNSLAGSAEKARKEFQKYLGYKMSEQIKNYIKGYKAQPYYNSMNYARAGNTIVLFADDEYYKKFPDKKGDIWKHHTLEAYLYLVEKLNFNKPIYNN